MIAERIKQARETLSISKAELARRVSVSRASVSMWEDGKNVSASNILKIAEVLNVEPEWLQYGVTKPTIKVEDLADCLEYIRKASTRYSGMLSDSQQAKIAAYLYRERANGSKITEHLFHDVIQRVESPRPVY